MSKYRELKFKPPVLNVNENAREVIITTVSCMCDNIHTIKLKKSENGDFSVSGGRSSLSNWQMKGDYITDLKWAADDQNWSEVFRIINSGTEVVASVRSR
ncbi:hypothetical protein HOK00_02145 [bacterium]|nr:hypothetical protein [bacterium]